jgi:hypothetical protein
MQQRSIVAVAKTESGMTTPQLTSEQIGQISTLVAQYITAQQKRFFPQAEPLNAAQQAAMNGFFTPKLLDTVRLLVLTDVRVENPPFYPTLASWGLSNLPDFSLMTAITFSDVVVSVAPCADRLLFH